MFVAFSQEGKEHDRKNEETWENAFECLREYKSIAFEEFQLQLVSLSCARKKTPFPWREPNKYFWKKIIPTSSFAPAWSTPHSSPLKDNDGVYLLWSPVLWMCESQIWPVPLTSLAVRGQHLLCSCKILLGTKGKINWALKPVEKVLILRMWKFIIFTATSLFCTRHDYRMKTFY